MKTIYYTATSLDGYIADSHGSLEGSSYPAFISDVGALAMGSTTFEWLVRHTEANGEPWPYMQPAWVFTTRDLTAPRGANVRFVRGDVRPVHSAMREAANGKNLWVVGGGALAAAFRDHGLLDEIIVQIAPVTLGSGSPLFPRHADVPALVLESVTRMGESFVELKYRVCRDNTSSS